jgi:TonB-dependent receptor
MLRFEHEAWRLAKRVFAPWLAFKFSNQLTVPMISKYKIHPASLAVCALSSLLFLSHPLVAAPSATTGDITGIVSNVGAGSVLHEARVEIPLLRKMMLTDEVGRFTFTDLEPGEYALEVSYLGLDRHRTTVRVVAGETAMANIDLTSEIYKLEAFVVTGEREGNAAALTRQRSSENLKNVVSMDAFGDLANDNPGDLLIRLPGVAGVIDDEGNVAGISVRGAPVGMTNFSVDGNQQASTGGLNRDFRTHAISAALFDELEVIKAPTPDMPADSLGGSVNFKTASTLRFKERRISYRATGRWAAPFYNTIPMREDHPLHALLSVSYQDIFSVFGGRNNLGVSLNMFYNENASGFDRRQMDYQYTLDSPAYLWDFRQINAYNNRKQSSASLRIDYKLSPQASFYFSMIYNDAFEDANRRYMTRIYSAQSVAAWDEGAGNWTGGLILPDYTDDITEARGGTTSTRVLSYSYLYSFLARERTFNTGGRFDLNRLKITYDANYNYSHSNLGDGHGEQTGGTFTMGTRQQGWIFDRTESNDKPAFTQTTGPDACNPASYDTSSDNMTLDTRDGSHRNTDIYNLRADLSYALPTSFASTLKAGAAWRSQEVDVLGNERRFVYQKAIGGPIARLADSSRETSYGREAGREMPRVDSADAAADMRNNPAYWSENANYAIAQYYLDTKNITEDVTAFYLQSASRIGRLNVLAGVRYEKTKVDGSGYIPKGSNTAGSVTNPVDYYNNPVSNIGDYDHWFPGVHLVYEVTQNFQARLSWSNSIGRPSLGSLVPGLQYGTIEDADDEDFGVPTVRANNPSLGPQTSRNWDISIEYYFEPVGLFSAGVFRKNVKDFLVTGDLGTIMENGNSAAVQAILDKYPFLKESGYVGQRVRSAFNGGDATIDGLELSYQQQLSFLPGVFKGTSVFANYTHLKVSGDYGDNSGGSTDEMARFVPDAVNWGFTWKYKKLTAETKVNYTGKQLWTYSPDRYRLLYRDSRTTVNFSLSYRLNRSATLSLGIFNAFNAPNRFYYYYPDRVQAYVVNGTAVTFGVSGRF